jgi:hypothetical protein
MEITLEAGAHQFIESLLKFLLCLEIVYSKIPNPKHQTPNKPQCSKSKIPNLIWTFEFGICLGFGYWILGF